MNVAVIGTGAIAPAHIEGLLKFPDKCKIVAFCDIYPEKAEAMAKRFQLDIPVFKDYKTMLEEVPEINLVHICTPPYTHAQLAIDVMDKKKHVVVEKPMAPSLKECDEMIEAQKRNGVMLSSIAQNRFRNSIYKLKKTVDSNLAGKICCAHVRSGWWRGHSYYDLWWRGLWEKEGGGPTLNHAVHQIDMINWIEGSLPTEVTAMLSNVMHDNSEVEDISFAILKYGDGSVAEVTSSVIHHGEEQGIELQCADAKIAAPWNIAAEVSLENGFPRNGGNKELIDKLNEFYNSIPDLLYEGHQGQIQNVLEALEKGEEPLITGEDGKRTVELITAIYKAGSEKQYVTLPIAKEDPYYTFDGLVKHATRFYKKNKIVENFGMETITLGSYKEDK